MAWYTSRLYIFFHVLYTKLKKFLSTKLCVGVEMSGGRVVQANDVGSNGPDTDLVNIGSKMVIKYHVIFSNV